MHEQLVIAELTPIHANGHSQPFRFEIATKFRAILTTIYEAARADYAGQKQSLRQPCLKHSQQASFSTSSSAFECFACEECFLQFPACICLLALPPTGFCRLLSFRRCAQAFFLELGFVINVHHTSCPASMRRTLAGNFEDMLCLPCIPALDSRVALKSQQGRLVLQVRSIGITLSFVQIALKSLINHYKSKQSCRNG